MGWVMVCSVSLAGEGRCGTEAVRAVRCGSGPCGAVRKRSVRCGTKAVRAVRYESGLSGAGRMIRPGTGEVPGPGASRAP
ncbi:hypothetical protein DDW44_01205 [Streptomyces tirandamycinicus]|uniref:Uncharacterized protein n=1 Tax=Streptomyces tirandamycinicus TaxID=2174846 RepID=A0A2S1SMB1_9ACTN|nr:hypothetical protein DDW44_01205 [Streptomyces tirandamycinicus]